MYCIIEMLKSKKYRSRFVTSNNNPVEELKQRQTEYKRQIDQIKASHASILNTIEIGRKGITNLTYHYIILSQLIKDKTKKKDE